MKRKILTAVVSFVVAFGMWLYVVTVVSPGYEITLRNIEVVCEGDDALQSRMLMREGKISKTITIRLEGNRSDLVKLNRDNVKAKLNLSNIFEAKTYDLPYTIEFPGDVPETAITVLSREPDVIAVNVVDRESSDITVSEPIIHGTPGPNNNGDYVVKTDLAEYDRTVEISGPKELVDKVDHVKFAVEVQGKTQVIEGQYDFILYDSEGNMLSKDGLTMPDKISATIPIHRIAEVPVRAKVTEGGGATEEGNVRVVTGYDENGKEINTIWVSAEDNVIRQLEAIWLEKPIDLSKITQGYTENVPLVMPEGVYCVSEDLKEVTVIVDFSNLVSKTFERFTITPDNAPEGLTPFLLRSTVSITVRGTAAQINRLRESDIRVSVDLKNAKFGKENRPLIVTFSDGFDEVGLVGEYADIVVDMRRTEE